VDETLRVNLSNPSSGTEIQGGTADGYVRNDDAEFNITAGTASVVEGDNGFTGTAMTYTVTRTGYLSQTNTVNWAVGHGTTNVSDFTNGSNANINPSGTLTFNSGVTTQTITVYAYGDTDVGSIENNETFNINLSGANAGSSIGATGSYTSTIQNDDTQITASIDDMRVAETVAGQSTTFTVTFTRSGDLNKASSLNWAVQSTSVYDAEENAWSNSADASDFGGSLPSAPSASPAARRARQSPSPCPVTTWWRTTSGSRSPCPAARAWIRSPRRPAHRRQRFYNADTWVAGFPTAASTATPTPATCSARSNGTKPCSTWATTPTPAKPAPSAM
jgi:hypothetical protein